MKTKLGQPTRAFPALVYSAVILYLFICVLHLAMRRMPWLDEIFLINNLKELSPSAIFGPLKYSQAFPRLYLYIIQHLSRAFHYDVLSLRILPFVFMLTGFSLWLSVFRRQEARGDGYLLFILCWCGSFFMTYYAAEFKQYSADVFAAGVFAYFILRQKESALPAPFRLGLSLQYLFLPALLLFSYASYFLVLIPLYNLFLLSLRQRRQFIYFAVYLFSLAMVSAISYNCDLKYSFATPALRGYWQDYFISTASPGSFMETFWEGLRNIFVRWFEQEPPFTSLMTIFMPFALYYLVSDSIRQLKASRGLCVSLGAMAMFLLAGLFAAGIFGIFPFTGTRVTLFIAPLVFYLLVKGVEMLKRRFWAGYAVLSGIFIFTLFSVSLRLIWRYLRGY
jgi:hypothetical protein